MVKGNGVKPQRVKQKTRTKEYVIALEGPRGAGKSAILALLGLMSLGEGRRTFSNLPIYADFAGKHLETEPLDTLALLRFAEELTQALVIIDEMQFFADVRDTMSNKNKMFNFLGIQIRKKQLTIAYSVQSFDWVDKRWRFQTDVLIRTQDASFTTWGHEERVGMGERFFLKFYDLSGVITGESAWQTGEHFGILNINGRELWNKFDTDKIVGIEEVFRRVEIDRTPYVVGLGGGGDGPVEFPDIDVTTGSIFPTDAGLDHLLQQYADKGVEQVWANDLRNQLSEMGVDTDHRYIGRLLAKRGVKSKELGKGTLYTLPASVLV